MEHDSIEYDRYASELTRVLLRDLSHIRQSIANVAAQQPHIRNLDKLCRRIDAEIAATAAKSFDFAVANGRQFLLPDQDADRSAVDHAEHGAIAAEHSTQQHVCTISHQAESSTTDPLQTGNSKACNQHVPGSTQSGEATAAAMRDVSTSVHGETGDTDAAEAATACHQQRSSSESASECDYAAEDIVFQRDYPACGGCGEERQWLQGAINNIRGFSAELRVLKRACGVVAVSAVFADTSYACDAVAVTAAADDLPAGSLTTTQPVSVGDDSATAMRTAAISAASVDHLSQLGANQYADERITPAWTSTAIAPAQGIDANTNGSTGGTDDGTDSSESDSSFTAAAALKKVEVDVVAQNGLSWIEVKALRAACSIRSHNWIGRPGHVRGIRQQILDRLKVAAGSANTLQWTQPRVVVYFPMGADDEVRDEIHGMGAYCMCGEFDNEQLPQLPASCSRVNMDVTTLCALVADGCWLPLHDEQLRAWSCRNQHWQQFYANEQQSRLMDLLLPLLEGKEMFAAASAVATFEKLLHEFGGASELQRWKEFAPRLTVVDAAQHQTPRVSGIVRMSSSQKDVFGVGDSLHAITLTANGRAVQKAAAQGVRLEVVLHHAAWLMGGHPPFVA